MTILAIDDDPYRYDGLRLYLDRRRALDCDAPTLTVTNSPTEVRAHLATASAVLLDYDLDGLSEVDGLPSPPPPYHKGTGWIDALAARKVPVIVVSANYDGGFALYGSLFASGVDVVLLRATDIDPEIRWLGWLFCRGVL